MVCSCRTTTYSKSEILLSISSKKKTTRQNRISSILIWASIPCKGNSFDTHAARICSQRWHHRESHGAKPTQMSLFSSLTLLCKPPSNAHIPAHGQAVCSSLKVRGRLQAPWCWCVGWFLFFWDTHSASAFDILQHLKVQLNCLIPFLFLMPGSLWRMSLPYSALKSHHLSSLATKKKK